MKVIQEGNLRTALLARRKELGMSQSDLAPKIGLSTMGLSYLERGTRKLKVEVLEKWIEALGMEIEIKLFLTKKKTNLLTNKQR